MIDIATPMKSANGSTSTGDVVPSAAVNTACPAWSTIASSTPSPNGRAIDASETDTAVPRRLRTADRSTSRPTTNMNRIRPIWAMKLR